MPDFYNEGLYNTNLPKTVYCTKSVEFKKFMQAFVRNKLRKSNSFILHFNAKMKCYCRMYKFFYLNSKHLPYHLFKIGYKFFAACINSAIVQPV